jgi:tRNA A37 threonylcarbamoyladenosine dehydratase
MSLAQFIFFPEILRSLDAVEALSKAKPHLSYIDAFSSQLRELFVVENKEFTAVPREEALKTPEFKRFCQRKRDNHVHIYFPWTERLVKCVESGDYFTLKTDRNQDLITAKEQKDLADYTVAILGMSVGSNIAFALTQAGISRKIILADPDSIETTNLNRILAGVDEIGINKAIFAARRIYEADPFSEVSVLTDGATEKTIEVLLRDNKVDCIVDEIDDIGLKIGLRKLALKYRVPVVMITDNGDGVVLHVERYDLGHDKIFGKDADYLQSKLRGPMSKDKAGEIIISDIVGGAEKVDPKMMKSVGKVLNHELVSWSQLGSAALLGAVMVTVAIKKIVLGESIEKDTRAHIQPFKVEVETHSTHLQYAS